MKVLVTVLFTVRHKNKEVDWCTSQYSSTYYI